MQSTNIAPPDHFWIDLPLFAGSNSTVESTVYLGTRFHSIWIFRLLAQFVCYV
jgi:hypothetical protein